MVAEIRDEILAGRTSTGTGCGFLMAEADTDVDVDIRAYHPGGLGAPADLDRFLLSWRYKVTRGAAATVQINRSVTDRNVGSPISWERIPSTQIPDQTVDDLLEGVVLRDTRLRRCTFNVRLEALTLTRNGYSRLDELDRADTAAFALIETA